MQQMVEEKQEGMKDRIVDRIAEIQKWDLKESPKLRKVILEILGEKDVLVKLRDLVERGRKK